MIINKVIFNILINIILFRVIYSHPEKQVLKSVCAGSSLFFTLGCWIFFVFIWKYSRTLQLISTAAVVLNIYWFYTPFPLHFIITWETLTGIPLEDSLKINSITLKIVYNFEIRFILTHITSLKCTKTHLVFTLDS